MKLALAPYLVSICFLSLACATSAQQSSDSQEPIQGTTSASFMERNVERESGPVNILFVLDCSYSMKEKFGGSEKKMNAAKAVLENAMARIPNEVNLGLRVFGEGFANVPEIDCRQTRLLVPLGQHNRGAIIRSVRQIEPFGLTPLEYAIRVAAESDFRDVQGKKTLIVITDGADTCGGNPCAYVHSLPRRGIRLKIDVVGVDLKREPAARAQLNCITEATGGKYYDANSSAEMIDGVAKSVDKAISGRVLPKAAPAEEKPKSQPDSVPPDAAPVVKPLETKP